MRIVILAHNLRVAGGLSVGKNIVAFLPKVAPQHDYLMVVPEGLGYEMHLQLTNVVSIGVPTLSVLKRAWFDSIKLPELVRDFGPDRLWGLGNTGLVHPPCPQALLFHKSHFVYPSKYHPNEALTKRIYDAVLKRHFKKCLRQTQLVFCQTEVIKKRFNKTIRYNGRISLCPNAVSYLAQTSSDRMMPDVIRRNKGKFILFTLTKYYTHKNLELIVKTFQRYRDRLTNLLCILTIDATQHPKAKALLKEIEETQLENYIIHVGPLEQSQLAKYFVNSDSLLFPSLLESFSATYLEAMYYGLPILTSDLDFARGICGNAALYFDPWDLESVYRAIERIRSDRQLRANLKTNGEKRLKFLTNSWPEIISKAITEVESMETTT